MKPYTMLRSAAAAMTAPAIALALHNVLIDVLSFVPLPSADWRFVVALFYGYLFLGFIFAGVAGKLAPSRGPRFMNLILLGSIAAGVLLALATNYAAIAEIVIALAVVTGAIGYGLRMRGFSEPLLSD